MKPKKLTISRAKSASSEVLGKYYQELGTILQSNNLLQIYVLSHIPDNFQGVPGVVFDHLPKWASSRENLSSGFPTKRGSNQSPQLQRLARKMKFHL